MQFRRLFSNIAGVSLAIGAMSASAFAVANNYPIVNNGWDNGQHHEFNGYAQGNDCGAQACCNEGPQCDWGYNPPAYLHCGGNTCQNGFLDSLRLRADFIWWRANAEGLALGVEQTLTQFPTDNILLTERVKKPNFKYDPGFRLGLATVCDCVDIGLNWTHYHTKAKAHGNSDFSNLDPSVTTVPPASVTEFFSFWEKFNEFTPTAQRARWNLTMDLLDLEIGHKYFVSSCFVLRPHMGLRGARIDQGYRTESFANRSAFGDVFRGSTHSTCDFLGVGPRLGVDAEWRVGCGLSVFGQAAASIVFGKNHRHAREEFVNSLVGADFTTAEYASNGSSDRVSRAITDLSIGLKWEHCFEFCCRQHPFSLAFSWEHHGFYNFNNFDFRPSVSPVDFTGAGVAFLTPDVGSRKHGDLFTQGLTVSAEFGF